jgi:predicted RNA-binding Zn-ribbon protein involved in translation (DUF1610 family)
MIRRWEWNKKVAAHHAAERNPDPQKRYQFHLKRLMNVVKYIKNLDVYSLEYQRGKAEVKRLNRILKQIEKEIGIRRNPVPLVALAASYAAPIAIKEGGKIAKRVMKKNPQMLLDQDEVKKILDKTIHNFFPGLRIALVDDSIQGGIGIYRRAGATIAVNLRDMVYSVDGDLSSLPDYIIRKVKSIRGRIPYTKKECRAGGFPSWYTKTNPIKSMLRNPEPGCFGRLGMGGSTLVKCSGCDFHHECLKPVCFGDLSVADSTMNEKCSHCEWLNECTKHQRCVIHIEPPIPKLGLTRLRARAQEGRGIHEMRSAELPTVDDVGGDPGHVLRPSCFGALDDITTHIKPECIGCRWIEGCGPSRQLRMGRIGGRRRIKRRLKSKRVPKIKVTQSEIMKEHKEHPHLSLGATKQIVIDHKRKEYLESLSEDQLMDRLDFQIRKMKRNPSRRTFHRALTSPRRRKSRHHGKPLSKRTFGAVMGTIRKRRIRSIKLKPSRRQYGDERVQCPKCSRKQLITIQQSIKGFNCRACGQRLIPYDVSRLDSPIKEKPLKRCPMCGGANRIGNRMCIHCRHLLPDSNPLTKQEIEELKSQIEAYRYEMDSINRKSARYDYLRGKVEAVNQIVQVYDGTMNEQHEMGRWAKHKNPKPGMVEIVCPKCKRRWSIRTGYKDFHCPRCGYTIDRSERYRDKGGGIKFGFIPGIRPKGNPGLPSRRDIDVAAESTMRFAGTDKARLVKISLPQGLQSNRVMSRLADFSGVLYFSNKWGRKEQTYQGRRGQHYIHEFDKKNPGHVCWIPSKANSEHGFVLAWRRCRLTEHGIED